MSDDDQGDGLGFSFALDYRANCYGCGRDVDFPDGGNRYPVEAGDGSLVVNGDGPCPQCRSTRVRVRVHIG